jgi:naphthalene 1,2-dioxygenase system ferredoxin subunit
MSNQWVDVTDTDGVFEGDVIGVEVAGKSIALYQVQGEIFATDNMCSHGNARLCDGFLEGYEIECPFHQGRFDIRSGKALCAPLSEDVRTYPVKTQGSRVYVHINEE